MGKGIRQQRLVDSRGHQRYLLQMPLCKHNSTVQHNTTKSRCETGYAGVVCAICDEGYYSMDDLCLPCLQAKGSAEALVVLVFGGTFGVFMFILLRQMRVKDNK